MRIEKLTGYASLAIVFTIMSISLGSAQNGFIGRTRLEPLSNMAFCFMMTIHFSVFFPLLLLMECIIKLFLRRLWKYPSLIFSYVRQMREKLFIANVALLAEARNLGSESMKPIVAMTALTIWSAYELCKLDTTYQICISGTALLLSMNFITRSAFFGKKTIAPVVAIQCVDSDITSCIKNLKSADWMDEKLATAEALIIEGKDTMRARCSMVRHVSHEVRTPLNTAAVGVMILEEEIATLTASGVAVPARIIEVLTAIRDACGNALEIVNDLLTFEKIEAGMMMLTKSRTPLVEFLKTNAKLQFLPALSKQIDITIFPPPDCEDIYVDIDPVKLGLVFGNLLSNAVKFTPAHGRIDVSISVNKLVDGGFVTVSVRDSGTGLSPENISRLFQEGVQFNANELQNGGGSGFGLYIAKAVVTLHDGIIWAESDGEGEGKGAVFCVQLPLSKDTGALLTLSPSPSPSPTQSQKTRCEKPNTTIEVDVKPLTILVVDDSESSRKMITRLLTISGHDCYEARDGNAAVNMISMSESRGSKSECCGDKDREFGLDSVTVDVVLMDNHMPGMTGSVATKKIRELGFKGLIIGLSGDDSCTEFKENGADKFLMKPVSRKELSEALRSESISKIRKSHTV